MQRPVPAFGLRRVRPTVSSMGSSRLLSTTASELAIEVSEPCIRRIALVSSRPGSTLIAPKLDCMGSDSVNRAMRSSAASSTISPEPSRELGRSSSWRRFTSNASSSSSVLRQAHRTFVRVHLQRGRLLGAARDQFQAIDCSIGREIVGSVGVEADYRLHKRSFR